MAAAGFHGAEFGAEPGGGTGDGDNPGLEGGERVKGLRESNVHYSGLTSVKMSFCLIVMVKIAWLRSWLGVVLGGSGRGKAMRRMSMQAHPGEEQWKEL